MFKKIELGLNFFILAMLVISILYAIISGIIGTFSKAKNEDIGKANVNYGEEFVNIYSDNEEYLNGSEELVKDYSEYYTVKTAVDNFMLSLSKENYSELYSIVTAEIKDKYNKKEFNSKMKEYVSDNISDEVLDNLGDVNVLNRVYKVSDSSYICELKLEEKIKMLGITLNSKNMTYDVFYIEF